MKKGDAKTFVLLGIFVLIGLLFMLFSNIGSINLQRSGSDEAQKYDNARTGSDEPKTPEELSERMFSDTMGEFKRIIVELEQKDTRKFKNDTQKAFNKLADVIGEFSSLTGDKQAQVDEKVLAIRREGEKISLLKDENKVVNEIKSGFTSANDSLRDISSCLNCDKAEEKALCDSINRKSSEIENKLNKIDEANYKLKTKEILADFHSILKHMHKEVYAPRNMTLIQPEDANEMSEQSYRVINKQGSRNDSINNEQNNDNDLD